jgi:hypothetical protein
MKIIRPFSVDFASAFTRASAATYFDKDGVFQTASTNIPRWGYDPETLEPLGLLVEPAVTNLLLRSEEFDNASWIKSGATVTADAIDAPDGNTTADLIVETSGGSEHQIFQLVSFVSGIEYAVSFFAKAKERSNLQINLNDAAFPTQSEARFDLIEKDVSFSGPGITNSEIKQLQDGWFFCSVSAVCDTTTTTAVSIRLMNSPTGLGYSGDGASGLYLWGAQLEAGSAPTSYIATTSATVTRAADVVSGGNVFVDVAITETEWTAGTYTLGTRRYVGTDLYEVVADPSTHSAPVAGAAADPPTWILVGKINKFRMFDQSISTPVENTDEIQFTVVPDTIINALAFFEVDATDIRIKVTDPVDGIVYEKDVSLVDNSLITDFYPYFFEPITRANEYTTIDLPPYAGARIDIWLGNEGSTTKLGECVAGLQADLGVTNFNTTVGIIDYSRKETDAFGNPIILERAFSKRAEYDVTVKTGAIAGINKLLSSLRATPIVYIGDVNRPETIVFGYYRDYNIILSSWVVSEATIEVEGLT